MNVEEYERMYQMEDTYWWFQGRMHMIEAMLATYMKIDPKPGHVLDVGCGTGLMLGRLKDKDPVGLDFSPLSLQFCKRRGITRLIRGDVTHLPFADNSLDLVLALDLIEHVERDDMMVKEVARVLRPGGYFMATVPAHQSLWSDHDVSLHHYRRYSYNGFLKLIKSSGLKPVKYSYGITFTYPIVVAFRTLQKMWRRSVGTQSDITPKAHLIPLPWFLNTPLIWVLQLEGWLLRFMNLPVGVSLMSLARKPQAPRRG